MHPSVVEIWRQYLDSLGKIPEATERRPSFWHFCDNEHDANTCATLVLLRRKIATAPSLWGLMSRGEPVPQPGELHVVTNWTGEAVCVIRTTRVEIVPFKDVTAEHAAAEGEGDGSLDFWRRTHWDYYERELKATSYAPREDMPIVCEYFEVVHPVDAEEITSSAAGS